MKQSESVVEDEDVLPENQWIIQKDEQNNRLTLRGPVYYKFYANQRIQVGVFECECGVKKELELTKVKNNRIKSCGCMLEEARVKFIRDLRKGTIATDGVKVCSNLFCKYDGVAQPVENFVKQRDTVDMLTTTCKSCRNRRKYELRYKRPYEEFEHQILAQDNKCDFCGKDFDSSKRMLSPVQDHNHTTLQNRGVLHSVCNLFIGYFELYPEVFSKGLYPTVLEYLSKWESSTATSA